MDEFAQTRGADDLFDDEIVPVSAEEQPQVVEEESAPAVEPEIAPVPVNTPSRPRGGERRGRGRGRGRGGAGRGGSHHSGGQKRTDAPTPRPKSVDSAAQPESEKAESPQTNTPDANATDQEGKPETAAASQEGPRVPAVRGDRSATGGLKKPKLTEEELSRRIAAAKELAAKKAAAHARAEADQASFLEREKVASEKRRQELQNRRVMDSERERNRQRKLQAFSGREWDADKQQEDFNSRGKQFRRGMHGGVSGYTRRDFEDASTADEIPDNVSKHASPRERGRGRGGRGGRGRGGARGGQRGDTPDHQAASTQPKTAPGVDNESEFPALPGGPKNDKDTPKDEKDTKDTAKTDAEKVDRDADLRKLESSLSPVSGTGATWADQVEGL